MYIIMINNRLFFKTYVSVCGSIGFYRGWMADYYYNKYERRIEKQETWKLRTERFFQKSVRGIINACFCSTFGNPVFLYQSACRLEIYMTQQDPYDHVTSYIEFGSYTALKPKD